MRTYSSNHGEEWYCHDQDLALHRIILAENIVQGIVVRVMHALEHQGPILKEAFFRKPRVLSFKSAAGETAWCAICA